MRALAIGRGSGMDDDRLVRFEHAVQIRHRRIEREEIVELECWYLAVERQRIVAAQRNPIRISNRSHCREPVERTAQHDREKAWVASFGTASFGRCTQANSMPEASSNSRRDGACSLVMIYLRRNSGAISSRVSACARLSARATVLRVSADASGPSPASTSATGSNRSATRPAKLLAMSTR